MNVLLIVVDTLRADHLGCYGYHRATSPFLDDFAARSVVCEQAIAPAIPTHPAFTTLYTGQYSIRHGVVAHGGRNEPRRDGPWLPLQLIRAGYTTCAVDNLSDWSPMFRRGFEFVIDPSQQRVLGLSIDNRSINERAIPWLEQYGAEPFFMVLHYWDPHTPYLPPRAYRRLFYEGDPYDPTNTSLDAMREHPLGQAWEEAWFKMLGGRVTDADYIEALYDGEIRFLDEGLAMLIGALEKQGLADDTLVVITGDHGELMYRHGVFFDHHGLYDGNLHVPLIVHHPSLAPRRVPQLVASIDVAPTILDFCQLETPPEMDGTALTPWLRGEREDAVRPYVVSQECTWQMKWSLRRPDEKVIVAREPDYYGTPPLEYYDLREDPDEMNNRADDRPERAAELAQELEAWLAARMAAHGLEEDPLVAHGLTLGRAWKEGRTADLPGPIPE